MKLSPYVLSKIAEEIKDELFRIWLETDMSDWDPMVHPDIREMFITYHSIFRGNQE